MVAQPGVILLHLSWCENLRVSQEFFEENFLFEIFLVCFVLCLTGY